MNDKLVKESNKKKKYLVEDLSVGNYELLWRTVYTRSVEWWEKCVWATDGMRGMDVEVGEDLNDLLSLHDIDPNSLERLLQLSNQCRIESSFFGWYMLPHKMTRRSPILVPWPPLLFPFEILSSDGRAFQGRVQPGHYIQFSYSVKHERTCSLWPQGGEHLLR